MAIATVASPSYPAYTVLLQNVPQNGPRFDSFYVSEYIRTKETAGEMDLDGAVWQPDIMVRERDQVRLDSCHEQTR